MEESETEFYIVLKMYENIGSVQRKNNDIFYSFFTNS